MSERELTRTNLGTQSFQCSVQKLQYIYETNRGPIRGTPEESSARPIKTMGPSIKAAHWLAGY